MITRIGHTHDAPRQVRSRVSALLANEPEHRARGTSVSGYESHGSRPLSLSRLALADWPLLITIVLLVGIVAVAGQVGPRVLALAVDRGMVQQQDFGVVVRLAAVAMGAVLSTVLAQSLLTRLSARLASRALHRLRLRVFAHLQRLSLDYYVREKAGSVLTRATADIENLQQFLQDGMAQMAVQVLTAIVIAGVLMSMDVSVTLVMLAATLPPLLLSTLWFRSRSEPAYQRVRDGVAAVLSDLSETLRGVRVLSSHNREHDNVVRHRRVVGEYRTANVRTAVLGSAYGAGTQSMGLLAQVLLLAVGGREVLRGTLSVGELLAFFLYLNRLFAPIQLLVQQFTLYQQSQASILKLRGLLQEQPTVADRTTVRDLPTLRGEIRLEGVTFGYDPASPVLRNVDLLVQPGETVALVGPTGAGKSTLAGLVTRAHDVTVGRVLLDGVDIRDSSLTSLRRQVLLVGQETFLFHATLRENLVYGRPDATDDEVLRAVDTLGLASLVKRLPEGLQSPVHERGQSLSAGERQLVALARAFLAEPRVLVLDEATANLDLRSERQVEQAMDALLVGRTAVLIAHRLSTAVKSDRIVVVDDNGIVECGSHAELLQAGGRYARMYGTWTGRSTAGRSSASLPNQ